LFEGLVTYVQDADGDGVTVLLVDSRLDEPGDNIPVHVPVVTFDSSNGEALNEVPWVLNKEDIEIKLDPPPATNHLDVHPNVWAWTGSMSQLTGVPSAIKPSVLDMNTATPPTEVVARVRLEHGTLEVDPRPEAVANGPVIFKAGATTHPSYSTAKVALLLKYTVRADKITILAHEMGKMSQGNPRRGFEPTAQSLRMFVGNVPALTDLHGSGGTDHHFARLYKLVSTPPPNLFLPNFPFPGVGTRVCMGGGR
jgi:hypothetical protein